MKWTICAFSVGVPTEAGGRAALLRGALVDDDRDVADRTCTRAAACALVDGYAHANAQENMLPIAEAYLHLRQ